MEEMQRSKAIMKMVLEQDVANNDYGRYQLHMQSCVYQTKPIMNRVDTKAMYERMENSGLEVTGKMLVNGEVPMMPPEVLKFLEGSNCWKIEWMDHGRYHCKASESYGENFMDLDSIMWMSKKINVSPKIVDYSGFNLYDMPIRMWTQSLYMQGSTMTYTGTCYWKKEATLCKSTMRMMSLVVNHSAIITATRMSKGIYETF